MNILHLVLGAKDSHYFPIEYAAKKTWAKEIPENIKTIFMYGGSNQIYWDNETSFYVDRPEMLNICLYKTLLAFETFLESNFHYIFRTNNTGYFDYNLINQFIKDKPSEKFYCGCLGRADGIDFASGSGYFLSKDLVSKIVKNKNLLLDYDIPNGCGVGCDDVLIGKFITQVLNIEIYPNARRLDVSPEDITDSLDMTHYHYRILFNGDSQSLYKIHELKNTK